MKVEIALFLGFLIGFFPFAPLFTRVIKLEKQGNTELIANVLLDALKGGAAVLIVGSLIEHMGGWAGIGVVAGHIVSTWLRFNSGKGLAIAAGVIAVLSWPILLVCFAVWSTVIATIRISSVASMVTVITAPIAAWALGTYWVFLCSVICVIILTQHFGSVLRLIRGQEPKLVFSKK